MSAIEEVDTLIIGAGQAGLAMSAHLRTHNIPHLLVERARIAERWRSERWDSLRANGTAWHDRFPENPIPHVAPDDFPTKDQLVAYFEGFAASIHAPVRCGVAVEALSHVDRDTRGFRAETTHGPPIAARRVVVATGAFQKPVLPGLVPHDHPGVVQLHASAYRNPSQLPPGAVLVVGSGSSGAQIADEILRDGRRRVYLSVGHHRRPPRRYRGRDNCWWLDRLGTFAMRAPGPATTRHVTIAVSGAHGGRTVDFREMAHRGMVLLGHAEGFRDGVVRFASDLKETVEAGDRDYLAFLKQVDELVEREGLDVPEEPEAYQIMADPACLTHPQLELDLAKEGVSAIVWATGYSVDYDWIKIDGALDATGRPRHEAGVSCVPGLYFLGLSFQSRLASAFIFGVWDDAKYLAERMAQRDGSLTASGSDDLNAR